MRDRRKSALASRGWSKSRSQNTLLPCSYLKRASAASGPSRCAAVVGRLAGQGRAPKRAPVGLRAGRHDAPKVLANAATDPKPARDAMRSTKSFVVSSNCCERWTQARSSHCSGVAPVCSRNRRPRLRPLMPARWAMSSSVGRVQVAGEPLQRRLERRAVGGRCVDDEL